MEIAKSLIPDSWTDKKDDVKSDQKKTVKKDDIKKMDVKGKSTDKSGDKSKEKDRAVETKDKSSLKQRGDQEQSKALSALSKLENDWLWKTQGFINGEWVDGSEGENFDVTCPADGSVLASLPRMNASDAEQACEAAHKAFCCFKKKTACERSKLIRKMADLMKQYKEDLALICTLESGKPLEESRGEIDYAMDYYVWFSEEAKRFSGEVLQPSQKGRRSWAIKQPVGPCGLMTPWNFPVAMITRKVGPALAAGCTVVLKPSSQTPMSALALCAIAEEAGVPKGVINCLTVDSDEAEEVGETLCTNEFIKKISFTGSTSVGKWLMEQSADTIKKISLELGGNAAFIVFDDADICCAVKGLMDAKFRNAGQTCISANRVFVHESIYDEFAEKLVDKVNELVCGHGTDEDVTVGPLINKKGLEKTMEHIQDAVDNGAKVLTGGKPHKELNDAGGLFHEPTVLVNMKPDMRIYKEETFGPVCPLFSFKTEAEAIEMANDTDVGLAAYMFTKDLSRAFRVSEALETGMVGINVGSISTANAPFGGVKESGLGREGGREGIYEYLEVKYVCCGIQEEDEEEEGKNADA